MRALQAIHVKAQVHCLILTSMTVHSWCLLEQILLMVDMVGTEWLQQGSIIHMIIDIVFMVSLHVPWEELAKKPQTLLLLWLHTIIILFLVFVMLLSLFLILLAILIIIGVVHEVNQVRIIIFNWIPVLQYILLAKWTIFLLFLDHLLVTFASCVIVWDLWFKFYHGKRVLRNRFLQFVIWLQYWLHFIFAVLHTCFIFIASVVLFRIPDLLFIRIVRNWDLPAASLHAFVVLFLTQLAILEHLVHLSLHRGRCLLGWQDRWGFKLRQRGVKPGRVHRRHLWSFREVVMSQLLLHFFLFKLLGLLLKELLRLLVHSIISGVCSFSVDDFFLLLV